MLSAGTSEAMNIGLFKWCTLAVLGVCVTLTLRNAIFGSNGSEHAPVTAATVQFRRPPHETFAKVFEPCAHCHEIGFGAQQSSGPPLNGIVGRMAAAERYPYSDALRHSGIVWNENTLHQFIRSPAEVVPGTRMLFGGLSEEKIDPLIAYIKSVSTVPQ
jgi:cytochrome c